ncbi:hypothetical protein BO85DRAFT_292571 [Aspergillus piperis CBS 112811]|uniref:Uncharacterized protein n=1 Tax=Aspergillus piperis CBS 112811 TaxID=1448313 RepID=A0A8G1R1V9_9EURO|nr:hypothetical protein BO85DRAFT_292571 [Aspergillus piperis CBS 112811]RAH58033.1 hypothetical protein BO85DRAFT_292571 [Aspergillus piperis CBS 112811]
MNRNYLCLCVVVLLLVCCINWLVLMIVVVKFNPLFHVVVVTDLGFHTLRTRYRYYYVGGIYFIHPTCKRTWIPLNHIKCS